MNSKEYSKYLKRNEVMRLLKPLSKIHKNVVAFNIGNTIEHEIMKFKICWQLANEEKEFCTEAIFRNGKRADILVVDDWKVIEILKSETIEQCKKKVSEYPEELEVIFVDAMAEYSDKLIY